MAYDNFVQENLRAVILSSAKKDIKYSKFQATACSPSRAQFPISVGIVPVNPIPRTEKLTIW